MNCIIISFYITAKKHKTRFVKPADVKWKTDNSNEFYSISNFHSLQKFINNIITNNIATLRFKIHQIVRGSDLK